MPKHTKRSPGASDADYFKGLGYKMVDDSKQEGVKRLETADEYVSRMSAMVLLYASIVQTESAGNPMPLSHGWTWMARCLNSMPPNRWVLVWCKHVLLFALVNWGLHCCCGAVVSFTCVRGMCMRRPSCFENVRQSRVKAVQ